VDRGELHWNDTLATLLPRGVPLSELARIGDAIAVKLRRAALVNDGDADARHLLLLHVEVIIGLVDRGELHWNDTLATLLPRGVPLSEDAKDSAGAHR
jgi:CubicO group peptidase (beta-lactamase class C family)